MPVSARLGFSTMSVVRNDCVESGLQHPVAEPGQQVLVAGPTMGREVGRQAHVMGEQEPPLQPGVDERPDPVEPKTGLPLVDPLDGVELDPGAPACEALVVRGIGHHVAVADDDATRVDAFLGKEVQLRLADRPPGGMRGDGDARAPVGACRSAEHALLDGADGPVAADLADDASADARVRHALRQVAHDGVRQLVHRSRVDDRFVEVGPAIVPSAHDDGHPGRLGDPPERFRVPPEPVARAVDEGAAAGLAEACQLLDRERFVRQEPRATVLAHEVDEHVLVRQDDAQVTGADGPPHGHHGRGTSAAHGAVVAAGASGTPG